MILLPPETRAQIPALYSTESQGLKQKMAVAKLFDPAGRFTFFVVEGSQEDDDYMMFGYVVSPLGPDCDELGYMSLNEIQATKNRFGMGMEQDLFFKPTLLSECMPKD